MQESWPITLAVAAVRMTFQMFCPSAFSAGRTGVVEEQTKIGHHEDDQFLGCFIAPAFLTLSRVMGAFLVQVVPAS